MSNWLSREPEAEIKNTLSQALASSGTQDGADILLTLVSDGQQFAKGSAANSVWRSRDTALAKRTLLTLGEDDSPHISSEALVSLGKLGQAHPKLAAALQSPNYYVRLNAAITYAYLGDSAVRPRLKRMRQEAATPLESVMLAAALAILGEPDGAETLHRALVDGESREFPETVDLCRLKGYLQDAVIAAFATAGANNPYLEAWSATLERLDPQALPVSAKPVEQVIPGALDPLSAMQSHSENEEDLSQAFRAHALVIGIANYPYVTTLPNTVLDDARDIAKLLGDENYCGYKTVKLLLDSEADKDSIVRDLKQIAKDSLASDTVIIFFSGHGGRRLEGTDAGHYLIPFDGRPENLRGTAIESEELTALLSAISAKRLVVFLDACHSAGTGELKSISPTIAIKPGLDEKAYAALSEGGGRVLMSSSRPDEFSFVLSGMKNSLFTHYLLEALRGACSIRGDGVTRVFDVFHYVADSVPRRAAQHPVFKAKVENNFPLALCPAEKRSAGLSPAAAATGIQLPRPATLSGKLKLAICSRLVSRHHELATYFEIPLTDQAVFERGREPQRILEWLEQRDRISELRDAFNYLGWDDLIKQLESAST